MENSESGHHVPLKYIIEDYWDIAVGIIAVIAAIIMHKSGNGSMATLFAAMGIAALSLTVSEIAEILSERLVEPYGSMVLTFSAVIVEIVLLYIILREALHSPEVVETVKGGIISAVIVDMNVLLGLAVFIGGLKYIKQEHNKETSSTYTTILFVTALALLVPSLLSHTQHGNEVIEKASYSIAAVLMLFYVIIFIFQTKTHTHFFQATAKSRFFRLKRKLKEGEEINEEEHSGYIFEKFNNTSNFLVLFILIATIAVGAEVFANDGVKLAKEYGISAGIAGLIIAIISVSPEIFTAIKAARNDQIQRVVNIAMGASVVSILLTVPILMGLAYLSGLTLTLDFNPLQVGALIMTVILAWKSTEEGQTNYFEGLSHLMFFVCYAIIAAYY
ncbi:sodium:proton exchanger [Sulfurovum sp.]|jgi:Ca2+:H+ antiporter|uniref:calcium:proton antiporter n=1 Tax=Sulfurovum sp. TaxID=1969726 RepID=UPI002A35E541|nr:sodium:proton exchanger [Sulfurovum sp.]MDD2450956.1 sodium:proton exchanger [Sulfurovum sp.]MDD3498915.1 sodium:proton exchanger [Sulfurovum sp.]MDY0402685.1 sodium:proton exchanger [Sulfurovum sp.]